MPLSSLHFIFVFLPIFLLLYYILPKSGWRNALLALGSLFFFGWSDPRNLPLLLSALLFNYILGRVINQKLETKGRPAARPFMWFAVVVNLLMLIFYKYTGFILENIADWFNTPIEYTSQALPLGISFFTFTGVSYILDIYNATEKAEKKLLRFGSYFAMFPKLLQGPITRFGQVKNGLLNTRPTTDEVMDGARRFIGGLAKKILLADQLGLAINKVFASNVGNLGAGVAWFALLGYALQIYLDFSGYTDMAIGLGKMLGFKLPENFNFPYISRSVSDFWRRWHMSLTSWFRTYLFIPLEFARKKEKFLRQQSNLVIVFLLTGLWHGADWNFILWGTYFGVIMALESGKWGKLLKKLPLPVQYLYSLLLVMLGWVFFRITDHHLWVPFLKSLVGFNGWTTQLSMRYFNVLQFVPILLLGVFFSLPFAHRLEQKASDKGGVARIALDVVYLVLFVLSIASILANGYSAFIYAQF